MTPCVNPSLARALAARLRDTIDAGERLQSFAWQDAPAGAPSPELAEGDELAVAHDFLLRVLRGVGDPANHAVLTAAAREGGTGIDVIAGELGVPRLVVTERANELIQLGLAARDLEHDRVALTAAGEALYELVCELDAEIAGWLQKRRRADRA